MSPRCAPLPYDRLYGWNPERVMADDAKARVERSLQRHRRAVLGEHGVAAAKPPFDTAPRQNIL